MKKQEVHTSDSDSDSTLDGLPSYLAEHQSKVSRPSPSSSGSRNTTRLHYSDDEEKVGLGSDSESEDDEERKGEGEGVPLAVRERGENVREKTRKARKANGKKLWSLRSIGNVRPMDLDEQQLLLRSLLLQCIG